MRRRALLALAAVSLLATFVGVAGSTVPVTTASQVTTNWQIRLGSVRPSVRWQFVTSAQACRYKPSLHLSWRLRRSAVG